MSQTIYCPQCGFENRVDAKFCKACGSAMNVVLPPQVQMDWSPTQAQQPTAPFFANAATAWLVAPTLGQRYPLSAYTTIGRGPGNTIVLSDSSISTQHAVITESGGQWQINDNNSRNGTWINRARVTMPCVLRPGDEVMLGTVALRFETNQMPLGNVGGTALINPAQYPASNNPAGAYAQPAGGTLMPANSRNKVTAGILAILLGGVGAHKFYLGKYAQGVVYLLFSWTGVPMIVGIIEGVIYLGMSDVAFAQKYG